MTSALDRQQIAKYLLAARKASEDFGTYCRFMNPDGQDLNNVDKSSFVIGPHHPLLFQAVQCMLVPRTLVMVAQPPRTGKSFTTTIHGATWIAGKVPNANTMCLSFGQELQVEFAGRHKTLFTNKRYSQVFNGTTIGPVDTIGTKILTNGHRLMNTSFYSGITGRGARFIWVDDPHKDINEANNADRRNKAWNTLVTSGISRMAGNASVFVTQTRWHDDDIMGRLLASDNIRSKFDHVKIFILPAEADSEDDLLGRAIGEPLWPNPNNPELNFDNAYYAMQRSFYEENNNLADYYALYQQRPAPPQGVVFQLEHWQTYEELPDEDLVYFAGSDHAIKDGTRNDFTVCLLFAMDSKRNIYLVDMFRKKGVQVDEVAQKMVEWTAQYSLINWHAGQDHITLGLAPTIKLAEKNYREASGDFVRVPLVLVPSTRDKEYRAQTFLGLYNQKKVFWPKNAAWVGILREELLKFPKSKHDDIVDAAASAALSVPRNMHGVGKKALADEPTVAPQDLPKYNAVGNEIKLTPMRRQLDAALVAAIRKGKLP